MSMISPGEGSHFLSAPDGDFRQCSPSSSGLEGNHNNTVGASHATTYPRLFNSTTEVSHIFIPYRWWEDEAATLLWAFEGREIQRVVRYGLLGDPHLPRAALSTRSPSSIEDFLMAIAEPREAEFIGNLSHEQRVEEILLRSRRTDALLIPWSWFPSQQDEDAGWEQQMDPGTIAAVIDGESRLHFSRIPFEELVRYAMGYTAASVDWFLEQHTALYVHLRCHLEAYPEEGVRYAEVEEHLRDQNPFVHRAIVQVLRDINFPGAQEMNIQSTPLFDFLTRPIQRLFIDHPQSLSSLLRVLSVLALRFRRDYVHDTRFSWTKNFDTAIPFVENLLASMSPSDLARTLQVSDEKAFGKLSASNIVAQDAGVRRVLAMWHGLSLEVCECCSALPEVVGYIVDCTQDLLGFRDYHSLTAIIHGLQRYSVSLLDATSQPPAHPIRSPTTTPPITTTASASTSTSTACPVLVLPHLLPPELTNLINPQDNFIFYREHFKAAPGIPFLVPHIRECNERGESVLRHLFRNRHHGGN